MNCNNHITGSFPVHTMYTTDRLILKILTPDDTNEVLAFQCRNRELFERYEPTRPPYFLTPAHQQAILKCEYDLARKCASIRFYVFLKTNPRIIIGTVCLHDILRMPYCCSEIGYKFDAAFQHQGYAREAVAKVLNIAFTDLSLHRVFARVMPEILPLSGFWKSSASLVRAPNTPAPRFRENGKTTSAMPF